MPMLLAMVGIWNRNFLHYPTLSITPYLEDLYYFPSFLQQLEMESNGKSVQHDGTSTVLESSPIIWGNAGTDCQHAYFQLLHQGADIIPVDFIAAITPHHTYQQHHVALLANCFAQSQALMQGKTKEQAKAELNTSSEAMLRLVPHRTFSGNRPSNTLLMDQLTPFALGNLIALYEHKVFVQGVVWNVNSFDQWGVELGKTLAKHIQIALNEPSCYGEDSSTEGLIQAVKNKLS
jgi:glucose-6-phosphate isomerase